MKSQKVVELNGKELTAMRKKHSELTKALTIITETILSKLEMENIPLGPDGIAEIRFRPNNMKTLIYSSRGLSGGTKVVGVYEDPPGICRHPTSAESKL